MTWLSRQLRQAQRMGGATAEVGVTTIGGAESGVYTRGEARGLGLCAPKGICWQPGSGDRVVVLKGGPGGEESCILGLQGTQKKGLSDGEVYLYTAGASIYIRNNGAIEITGKLYINGEEYKGKADEK
jgi:hypothetical protein